MVETSRVTQEVKVLKKNGKRFAGRCQPLGLKCKNILVPNLQNFRRLSQFLEPNSASTKCSVTKCQIVPLSLTKIKIFFPENDFHLMQCSGQSQILYKMVILGHITHRNYAAKIFFNPQ